MAKDKKKDKPNGAKRKPAENKKLGERAEEITVKLSQKELEDERERFAELYRAKADLEEKAKASAAEWKAKIAVAKERLAHSLDVMSSAKRTTEIVVIEYLTPQNEIIRVRKDTNEQIGKRTARVEELQEKLFDDEDDADESTEPKEPPSEAAAEGEAAGDFGGDAA